MHHIECRLSIGYTLATVDKRCELFVDSFFPVLLVIGERAIILADRIFIPGRIGSRRRQPEVRYLTSGSSASLAENLLGEISSATRALGDLACLLGQLAGLIVSQIQGILTIWLAWAGWAFPWYVRAVGLLRLRIWEARLSGCSSGSVKPVFKLFSADLLGWKGDICVVLSL